MINFRRKTQINNKILDNDKRRMASYPQNAPLRRYSSIAVRMTKPPQKMFYNIKKIQEQSSGIWRICRRSQLARYARKFPCSLRSQVPDGLKADDNR